MYNNCRTISDAADDRESSHLGGDEVGKER